MPTMSPNRQGALPLHLTLAMAPWIACLSASALSRPGLKGLSMPFPASRSPAEERLREACAELLADPLLASAAEKEARKRAVEFLEGLRQYQQSTFRRDVEEPAAVLKLGSARLLRYGAGKANAPAVLLIPSLINRYYILDLTQYLSFARYLGEQGFNVYAVDWDVPSEREQHYNCALYVTEILVPFAEWIRARSSGALTLSGYCMGGLLAMGLAHVRPDLADAAAFLATPWDFSVPEFPRFSLKSSDIIAVENYLQHCGMLSAETIHTLFQCANPYAFHAKLRHFGRMDKAHPSTQEFLAIEHWVNDGVPMAQGVAYDCLIGWSQHNIPALGGWRVGGRYVDPASIQIPCFAAVPQDDRIVPSACALPLVGLLRNCTLLKPMSGHVGMMVGSHRKSSLWEPFVQWINRLFS